MNHMTNPLFYLFVTFRSTKITWEKLEVMYEADGARKKKYVVGKRLRFHFTDDKPIMEQVHVFKNLCAEMVSENMKMCEIIHANVLIEKFSPSWSNYRCQLRHKKKDLTLQELISHMTTEEANPLKDIMDSLPLNYSKANLV